MKTLRVLCVLAMTLVIGVLLTGAVASWWRDDSFGCVVCLFLTSVSICNLWDFFLAPPAEKQVAVTEMKDGLPYYSHPCGFAEACLQQSRIRATDEEIAARKDGSKDPDCTEDEVLARLNKQYSDRSAER